MTSLLDQLKDRLKNKISELNYNTWFRTILSATAKEDTFVLSVPNKFIADWINDYYSDLIRRELFSLTENNYRIAFDVLQNGDPLPAGADRPPETQAPSLPKARFLDSLNPRYAFDRFVVGSSNQFAHAACKAVADLPGGHYNPLFLYGGVGLGKTHLMHAMGIHLNETREGFRVIYMSAERFMNELINALRYQKMPEFRKKFRDRCDALLLDDVPFLGGKDRTQDELFHTFDYLHGLHKQLVFTSDRHPRELQGIEERLRSRFEWGLTADIGPPDLETRIAILKKKAEVSGLRCPDDVAMFLASAIKSNVRELEGTLIRINAFASLTGAQITMDLAREILGDIAQDKERRYSIESIQRIVAEFYKLNISDLKSPKRTRSLSHPRQVAMYLCKKHVHSSFPEIGTKFGGKDHTTVMHACKKIERLLSTDHVLQSDISSLEKNILH